MIKPSKWQRLPTEAINPATRAIDTLPMDGIIELMILDNRQRARGRSARNRSH